MSTITMGCDPELFLFDNIKQRIVPAIGKVGGTKWKPMKLDGGMVQLDGTLVEFGIDPDGDIGSVINTIRTKLDNRFHGRYELRCGSTVAYHPDDIDPESGALDVGCSAQYMFNSDGQLVQLDTGVSHTDINRVHAGGHIHIGFTSGQDITSAVMLRSCKLFSDYLRPIIHVDYSSPERVTDVLGGGAVPVVRVKPYGIEFRNPCSIWLADSTIYPLYTQYMEHVFYLLRRGRTYGGNGVTSELIRLRSKLMQKFMALQQTSRKVPAKYQGTLPLDY